MENLGKRSGATDASINRRLKEIEEWISGEEDTLADSQKNTKNKTNNKNLLSQKSQEIQDTTKTTNLRIIRIVESEDSQLKGPENIFTES